MTLTKWFGKNWGAPICRDAQWTRTPVGAICEHCLEPIERGDNGITMPVLDEEGRYDGVWHYECHMRSIIGSVAHQLKQCSCYVFGATESDPPELTTREAARLAVELWEKSQR